MTDKINLLTEIYERYRERQSETDDLIKKINMRRKITNGHLEEMKQRYLSTKGTLDSANRYRRLLEQKIHIHKEKLRNIRNFLEGQVNVLGEGSESWCLCKEVLQIMDEENSLAPREAREKEGGR